MSSIFRFLVFVPPTLLFVLPLFGQIQGKIEQIPGSDTYQVSIISTANQNPPNLADQGQITLRAITGEFQVDNLQNATGNWFVDNPNIAPAEAPNFDYFSFQLQQPVDFDLSLGNEIPLFTFENALGRCTYIEIIDDSNDPFLPPNSQNSNIGNFLLIVGSSTLNSYEGNSPGFYTDCPVLDADLAAGANPVPCHGDLTALDINVIGGLEPYQIYWQGLTTGGFGTTQVTDFEGSTSFEDFAAGIYEVTIVDDRDSAVVVQIEIEQPDKIDINLLNDDAGCDGSMDGQMTAFVNGGTVANDYQYFWSTNPGVAMSNINGMLDPGTYSVTVVDDNGCDEAATGEIGSYSIIFLNPQVREITCFGATDGVVDLYPVSPSGPFTFEWSSNVSTGNFSSAWQLGAGVYEVTVTDNTGICNEVGTFTLEEPPAIEVDYRLTEPQCFDDPGYVDILAVDNAAGNWTATIIGNATEVVPNTFEVDAGMPLRLVVTDDNGCEVSDNFIIPGKQELTVDLGPDREIKYGENIQLDPDIFPHSGVTLEWIPTDYLDCTDCPDPDASPTENITYRLLLTDEDGCTAEDEISIAVRKSRDIYIPNAFSPNQDGINDIFSPFGGFEVVSIQSMQVYDRWGGLVFSNTEGFSVHDDLKNGWDGTARNQQLDPGTYLYTMNVEFIDGEVVLFSGEVNLMR